MRKITDPALSNPDGTRDDGVSIPDESHIGERVAAVAVAWSFVDSTSAMAQVPIAMAIRVVFRVSRVV